MFVQSGRHEFINLRGDDRKPQEHRREERHLDVSEESLVQRGEDHAPLLVLGGERVGQRLHEKLVDVWGKPVANEEEPDDPGHAVDQPPT